MGKEMKTNAARLLDKAGVKYGLNTYVVDESDLSAVHVAQQLGVRAGLLFKTLVLHGDRSGYFVCVVPGDAEVDLKKVAKVSGNKKVELIPVKNLLPLTGYIRGGCSPIGMKKKFPVVVDESAKQFDTIIFSAGKIGYQVETSVIDLEEKLQYSFAAIVEER